MKIGLNLPQMGHLADANATQMVAVAAEAAGFSSLWVIDRLLAPVAPRSPYPGTADGSLPVEQQRVLDPLVALSFAASVTERIRVGTDVLVAPWYPPALLARSLATLDHISNGRLTVGLGLGWSVDEYDAVGVPMAHLGARLEEIIDVMTSLWHDETVSVETSRERIAPSIVGLKPTQSRLPLLLASFNPAGLERVARRADGWLPVGMPLEVIATMWTSVLDLAEHHGRSRDDLHLVVRADPKFTEHTLGPDRLPFVGSRRQVIDDIERTAEIGAAELILDLQTACRTADELIDTALELAAHQLALAPV